MDSRRCAPFLLCLLLAAPAAARDGVDLDALVPRQVRVSIGDDHTFVSVRSRVTPADLGVADWTRWDRDASGALEEPELAPLRADLKRAETEHLCVTVDGVVVPVSRLALRIEETGGGSIGLGAALSLRIEGKLRTPLPAGAHRFTVYDEPRDPDGVVPFRVAFGRGLTASSGGGARGEIRSAGQRVEVVTSKAAPIFWGIFHRTEPGAGGPAAGEPAAVGPGATGRGATAP